MAQHLTTFVIALLFGLSVVARGESGAPASDPVAKEPSTQSGPQRGYNPGKVLPFPRFSGEAVMGEQTLAFKPSRGNSVVVIFIASWCEPCQILMPELKQLARKHTSASTKVFFVFSHDTKADASAFAREHQINSPSIMSNVDILTDFKNPELPSVYVGDKWGLMADRFIRLEKRDVDPLDSLIAKINAL